MNVLQITCDNCGAKYKLPPTFTGAQAKCQKCGSVIDVARQRAAAEGGAPAAAAKPAATAKPAAAARPAVDRSKTAPKPAKAAAAPAAAAAAKPARAGRPTTRGARAAKGDEGGDDGGSPRRGREAQKKSSALPLVGSLIGLVAIVVVVVVLMNSSDEQPAKDPKAKETAQNDAGKPPAAQPTPPNDAQPTPPPANEATKPADAAPTPPPDAAPPTDRQPAEASTPPAAEPAAPAESDDPSRPKQPWEKMRNPPQSVDQLSDPKNYAEVEWPADIDAATKAEVQSLAEDASDTGIRAIRARKALVEKGYPALFAIVERLRLLDYMSTEDAMTGYAFNKALEEITGGMNARYETVEASETLVPAKAEWNIRTVKAWLDTLAKWPDQESFQKARAALLQKQADADKAAK